MNQFLRSFLKIILTLILVFSILSFIFTLSFYQFTSYGNLQPKISSFVQQQMSQEITQTNSEDMDYLRDLIIENCSTNQQMTLPMDNPDFFISEISFDCSNINNETSTEQIMTLASESIFKSIYYKEYPCSVIDCIKNMKQNPENIPIIVSKKSNDFFFNCMLISFILSVILIAGIILLSKPKYTCFYNLAPAFIIPGLFFLLKNPINQEIQKAQEPIAAILTSLSNIVFTNYMIFLILGLIFLVLGIIFKIVMKKKK